MASAFRISCGLVIAAAAWCTLGCDEEKGSSASPTATATATAPPEPKPSAAPVASAPPEPQHDCPEGSKGPGSFNKPCEASGTERMMEVTWTGKMGDTGPSFRVVSKSKLEILYGKVVVYFYDKAGKQLEANDLSESPPKKRPKQVCAGNIFDGPMKAGEKAVITFSCVKKGNVPDEVAAIEAEMEVVGFTDGGGKKNEFYWRNKDLTPDERPKGKAKKK